MPGGQPSRWAVQGAVVFSVGLGVAACGQGPGSPGPAVSFAVTQPSPRSAPTNAASAPRPTAPLTGLSVASLADVAKPAVAVAVGGGNPIGLTSADAVFEEMTTPARYLAVYQSGQARAVGPVTATQPADRQALTVLHPVLAYSGAAPFVVKLLDKSKV